MSHSSEYMAKGTDSARKASTTSSSSGTSAKPRSLSASTPEQPEESRWNSVLHARTWTILLISNDDDHRVRTRAFLESKGFLVFSSADVKCASEVVFCARDVNLLIIDEDSLGARGLELASELTSNRRNIPVVILTGTLTPSEVFEEIRSRGWRRLRKLLPLTALLAVMLQELDGGVRPGRLREHRVKEKADIVLFPPPVPYLRPEPSSSEGRSLTLLRREGEVS